MSDRPMNRRSFFRQGLAELVKSVQKAVEPIADVAKEFSKLEQLGESPTVSPSPSASVTPSYYWEPDNSPVLRPPGARPEEEFQSICSRCGECVRVCPVQAIQMDSDARRGGGAPYIDPTTKACVLCEGMMCSNYCPSGALLPVTRAEVRMGLASWREDICLRTLGQPCQICVEKCPIGESAIRVNEHGRIEVVEAGCVGCGVCEYECPSSPKSITIAPKGS